MRHPDLVAGTLAHALGDPIEHKLPRVKVPTMVTRGSREPIVPMARRRPPPGCCRPPSWRWRGPHNANYGVADQLTGLVLAFARGRVAPTPTDPVEGRPQRPGIAAQPQASAHAVRNIRSAGS